MHTQRSYVKSCNTLLTQLNKLKSKAGVKAQSIRGFGERILGCEGVARWA